MKRLALIAVTLLGFAGGVSAQSLGFSANMELMSKYIWRGMAAGNFPGPVAPGASTDVGLNFTGADENFYAEAYFWTYQSVNIPMHYSEYQFTLYAETHGFFVEYNHYFGNMGEVGIGYALPGSVPVSLAVYTSLYGDDYDETDTKRNFSNYIELAVPYSIGNWDIKASFGAVPHKSVYYENDGGFAVSNMLLESVYNFELNDVLTLPVKAAFGYSPLYQNLIYYACVGLSVAF